MNEEQEWLKEAIVLIELAQLTVHRFQIFLPTILQLEYARNLKIAVSRQIRSRAT